MSSSLTLHDFEVVARRLPVPAFDASDLLHFGSKASRSLDEFIRHGASEAVKLPQWAVDRASIEEYLGYDGDSHCLGTRSHEWLHPLERQATEGLAHFLKTQSDSLNRSRALALLHSLDRPASRPWPDRIRHVAVTAERQTEADEGAKRGRIDLLIVAEADDGARVGAVIEAKFEHKLGGNPLAAYEAEAKTHGLEARNASYLIVGVRKDASVRAVIDEGGIWRFQSWRRLLRNLERNMSLDIDDDDYRRFRSTLFKRCNQEKR